MSNSQSTVVPPFPRADFPDLGGVEPKFLFIKNLVTGDESALDFVGIEAANWYKETGRNIEEDQLDVEVITNKNPIARSVELRRRAGRTKFQKGWYKIRDEDKIEAGQTIEVWVVSPQEGR